MAFRHMAQLLPRRHKSLFIVVVFYCCPREINPPYLVLLSASHHIEKEVYAAFIDNGHPLQERYLIWTKEERDGLGLKE